MAFSFANSYNTKKIFDIDTTDFEYCSLEELFEENASEEPEIGEDGEATGETKLVCREQFKIFGLYINEKSKYDPQPIVALADRYVNLPSFMYKTAVDILNNPRAIDAINKGHVGFTIGKYYQKKYDKECFKIEWVDM